MYPRLLTILLGTAPLVAHASGAEKPNIVVIMFDDLGVNDLGAYTYPSKANPGPPPAEGADNGGTVKTGPNAAINLTPHIDSLAAAGVRMTHFYATEPVCSASRASLMTGCYSRRTQINGAIGAAANNGLNSTEVTLPEVLRECGYMTAAAGKWHLGAKRDHNPLRHGFQRFRGILYSNDMWPQNPYNSSWPAMYLIENESQLTSFTSSTGGIITGMIDTGTEQSYLLEAMTEHALESIELAAAASKPFFLYFSPHTPHVPIHPHPDFLSAAGQTDQKQRYLDQLAEIDHRIGQLLGKLDDPNGDSNTADSIANNTLVILTSDNGPWHDRPGTGDLYQGAGSAYPFRGAKHTNWEGGHRVGMLARLPGVIPAGTVLHQTAANMDLFPTLVKLVGGTVPADRAIDGVDLWPLLTGASSSEPHDYFYFYDSGATVAGGVLDLTTPNKFKLIENQLFRMGTGFSADFQESTDVSTANAALKTTLAGMVTSWNNAMSPRPSGDGMTIAIELENDAVTVPEGATATARVRLSGSANATVTVTRFSGDSDLSVTNGATLTFTTGNWSQWQTVTFAATPDSDGVYSGATFRASSAITNVREIFVFEADGSVPAALTGLAGSVGPCDISLTWNASGAADFASYNVYRRAAGAFFRTPLAVGLTAPAYHDLDTPAGTVFHYMVTAVDLDGNESPPSAELTISAGMPVAGRAAVLLHHYDNDPGAFGGAVAATLVDGTAHFNNGTTVGSPTYASDVPLTQIPGTRANNALSLDLERNNSQYYTVADSASLDLAAGGAITIEAWVRLETVASSTSLDQRQYLVFKKSGAIADTAVNYGLLVNSAGGYTGGSRVGSPNAAGTNLTFVVGNGSAFQSVHSTLTVADSGWHFVAVRFNDATNTVRFTVDGAHQDVTGVTQVPAANALNLLVGTHTDAAGVFDSFTDAEIDELRISNTWLADSELLTQPAPQDPFADWIACHNVGAHHGKNDDADSDGIINLFEFLFDTNPAMPNPWPITTSSSAMTVTLRDLTPGDGITVAFQSCIDLKSWTARPDLVTPAPDQSGVPVGFTRWRFSFAPGTEPTRYVRLRLNFP